MYVPIFIDYPLTSFNTAITTSKISGMPITVPTEILPNTFISKSCPKSVKMDFKKLVELSNICPFCVASLIPLACPLS